MEVVQPAVRSVEKVDSEGVGVVKGGRGAAALIVGAALLAIPTQVMAAGAPGTPGGIHAVGVTASSFTAVVDKHSNTTSYRLYISGTKSNVYVANISRARKVTSGDASITVTGLTYWTKPYWYRIQAVNGSSSRWSEIHSVYLRPAVPTDVRVTSSPTGTWLTWDAGRATGFQIVRATDPTLMQDRLAYTTRSEVHQFSPYPLQAGTTYWFAVRSINGSIGSGWSAPVTAAAGNSLDGIRVMTYNLTNTKRDGTKAGDGVIAPWSQRAPAAVSLIRSADPDVIAFQEGGGWVGPSTDKVRQVDDLRSRLGSDYQLVRTEVPPTEPGYFRTGTYIMIKKSTLTLVGPADHWDIGGAARVGAYAELQSDQTGARFLFVATHLTAGRDQDDERRSEMTTLLGRAKAQAASLGDLPIVIGGDFNSHQTPDLPNDAVSEVTRDQLFADAITAAQSISDTKYNSANQYYRTPPAAGVSIDHIFTSPGVAVVGFRVVVKLVNGRFSGAIPSDHNPLIAAVSIPS